MFNWTSANHSAKKKKLPGESRCDWQWTIAIKPRLTETIYIPNFYKLITHVCSLHYQLYNYSTIIALHASKNLHRVINYIYYITTYIYFYTNNRDKKVELCSY